jgi:hypothetical protein
MEAERKAQRVVGRAVGQLARFVVLASAIVLAAGVASAAGRPGEALRLAYLDPGSGSFILQALVAMLAGAIVAINAYWTRIKSFLGLSKAAKDDSNATGAESGD